MINFFKIFYLDVNAFAATDALVRPDGTFLYSGDALERHASGTQLTVIKILLYTQQLPFVKFTL